MQFRWRFCGRHPAEYAHKDSGGRWQWESTLSEQALSESKQAWPAIQLLMGWLYLKFSCSA